MNNQKEIHTMYWVTHPAFALPWANEVRVEDSVMQKFFSQVLENLVKNIQRDPNSVMVLVRSPSFSGAVKMGVVTTDKLKKIEKFESEFEAFSKRMLKDRFVLFRDTKASVGRASAFVNLKLKKRGFVLSPKTKVVGAGSYLSACSKYYPLAFIEENHPLGKRLFSKVQKEFERLTKSNSSSELVDKLFQARNKKLFKFFRTPESMNIEIPLKNKQVGFAPRKIKSFLK